MVAPTFSCVDHVPNRTSGGCCDGLAAIPACLAAPLCADRIRGLVGSAGASSLGVDVDGLDVRARQQALQPALREEDAGHRRDRGEQVSVSVIGAVQRRQHLRLHTRDLRSDSIHIRALLTVSGGLDQRHHNGDLALGAKRAEYIILRGHAINFGMRLAAENKQREHHQEGERPTGLGRLTQQGIAFALARGIAAIGNVRTMSCASGDVKRRPQDRTAPLHVTSEKSGLPRRRVISSIVLGCAFVCATVALSRPRARDGGPLSPEGPHEGSGRSVAGRCFVIPDLCPGNGP